MFVLVRVQEARDIHKRVGSKIEGTVVLLNNAYVSIRQHTHVSICQRT